MMTLHVKADAVKKNYRGITKNEEVVVLRCPDRIMSQLKSTVEKVSFSLRGTHSSG